MSEPYDLLMRKDTERADADCKEAIVFLAAIISKEDRQRIRLMIGSAPEFRAREHLSLGMKTRNVLRWGGFFYNPHLMDYIWFPWLKKAVDLPENEIALTDSIKERIKSYETQERLANPPMCPQLEEEQIGKIIKQLEENYGISFPAVNVEYSDDGRGSFLLVPPSSYLDEFEWVKKKRDDRLRLEGLKEHELQRIDSQRFTIFLGRRQPKQQVGLYASAWHELAHVAASILGIKDTDLSESFAYANELKGLLKAAKDGVFSREEVFDTIEFILKSSEFEQLDAALFSKLARMGLHGIPKEYTTPYHFLALKTLRKHNPELEYRSRSAEVLVAELDNTIQDILRGSRSRKRRTNRPLIFGAVLGVALIVMFVLWALL